MKLYILVLLVCIAGCLAICPSGGGEPWFPDLVDSLKGDPR